MLKFLAKRNSTTLFFIIAFTIGILIFSIGNSAIKAESNRFSKDAKQISLKNYENLQFKDIKKVLKDSNLKISLRKPNYNTGIGIETRYVPKGESLKLDMKTGKSFTEQELNDNGLNGIYSSRFDDEIEEYLPEKDSKVKINKVATYYEADRIVIISNELFDKFYDDMPISDVLILVTANDSSFYKLVNELEEKFKENKIENVKEGVVYMTDLQSSESPEAEALYKVSIMIFIITIINSISISSLWVKNRKKEIVLRKVMGATDIDIAKIFFGELLIIAILSLILALAIQNILVLSTSGFIESMDLRPNIISFITSFIVAVVVSLATTIPSFMYISKIQPAEMLKED